MTKQERSKIMDLESDAWLELCRAEYYYVREHFPFGYGYVNAQLTQHRHDDEGLRTRLYTWNAYNSVLGELKIATQDNPIAREYSQLTWQWLEGIAE